MSENNIENINSSKSYGIYRVGSKCFRIVKNLKDYSDEKEAIGDLVKLLDGDITERDLIGSNFEQDIEVGKLGCRINCLEAALERIRDGLTQAVGHNDKLGKTVKEVIKQINGILEVE